MYPSNTKIMNFMIQDAVTLKRDNLLTATHLAEDAAYEFDYPEWLDDETHIVWDLAVKVLNNLGSD